MTWSVPKAWVVAGAAAIVFVLLVVVAQLQRGGDEVASSAPSTSALEAELAPATDAPPAVAADDELWIVRRDPSDPTALGDADAPIVLIEWLDLRCPFCALFSRETLPTLIDEYVDAGLVRIEVRTVDYFGGQSGPAAVAALAAGEQDMFHEYLQAVYAAAPDRGHPDLPRDELIAFAEQVGIPDIERFVSDLDREDLRRVVSEQTSVAGGELGIMSVPFFLVGDLAIAGAHPVDVFREVLDDAIADAGT